MVISPPIVPPPLAIPPQVVPTVLISGPSVAVPISAIAAAPQFAVVDGGVRMPVIEDARPEAEELAEERPVPRPVLAPARPVVPVYPRKQARH